jgi:hypothetical protein
MATPRLVFVYNTNEGFFNALTDTVHKIFSPETHQCGLCRFTYDLSGMLMPWKRFVDSLSVKPVFFHRTEFRETYRNFGVELPVIFREHDGRREIVLSAQEIAVTGGVEVLISAVTRRLAALDRTDSP